MADIPTIARQRALNCEAKKHAYRQTQDGVVVSFVLHPQEIPDELALAPLGQRFILAMVALNDDETPKEVMPNTAGSIPRDEPRPGLHKTPPASGDSTTPARARKSWADMTPSQQAGVLCADKSFQAFMACASEEDSAYKVRLCCGVKSRKDIQLTTAAASAWRDIVTKYRAWMREPEVVP